MTPQSEPRQWDWPVTLRRDNVSGWWVVCVYDTPKTHCRNRSEAEDEAARLYRERSSLHA